MTSFIGQKYISNLDICDKLINYHKNNENKVSGALFKGDPNNIEELSFSEKKSTDVRVSPHDFNTIPILTSYLEELHEVAASYAEHFKYCNAYAAWGITEICNIQHYKPNEGFVSWHTERGSSCSPISARHLVFMTYLNDVEDGGETEFYHQQIKIKAKKGLTLIFPADWTHTHRGITSETEEKYIITGWFNFLN